MYGFPIPTPSPSPTNKHTHPRVCLHLHTQHINEKHLQLHHFAWHIKNSIGVCVGVCTGFPSIELDLSNGYQGYCIQGTVWAQVSVCKDCFDSLSDRRSDERCEGAGKTACELLYSQSRVCVVGSQLFRAAGNTETDFSNLVSIASITAWQSFIKEGACQG